jgi:hypothetical protein
MTSTVLEIEENLPRAFQITTGKGVFNQLKAIPPEGWIPPSERPPEPVTETPAFLVHAEVFSGTWPDGTRLLYAQNVLETEAAEVPYTDGLYVIQHARYPLEIVFSPEEETQAQTEQPAQVAEK